jgi:ubiquinone/menaquinone biosynthesis C-methylase UbiE
MSAWNEILKDSRFRMEKPINSVVELSVTFNERGVRRILDLGCGAGRHLVYLAKRDFEMYGIDVSEAGLRQTQKRLRENRIRAELKRSDMTAIDYPDSFFDAVLSVWVIHHSMLSEMRKAISEICRILKKNGLVFLTFQSKRSSKYKIGKRLEKDTYAPEDGVEKGVPHHFSDLKEIETLMGNFRIISIKLDEFVSPDQKLNSHWEVLAEKE